MNNSIVFIHIAKNAGTSIVSCLKPHIICTDHNPSFDKILAKKLKTLIVIRHPVDRFISAVNYTLNNKRNENVSKKIASEIKNPDQWSDAFFDIEHPLHEDILEVMKTRPHHKINNKPLKYRWHWSDQYLWIQNPTYVILYDYLVPELNLFCSEHLDIDNLTIPWKNKSPGEKYVSLKNYNRIISFYQQDYELYKYYTNQTLQDRLKLSESIDPIIDVFLK